VADPAAQGDPLGAEVPLIILAAYLHKVVAVLPEAIVVEEKNEADLVGKVLAFIGGPV